MYLRRLYAQHKGWFVFVCLFIAAQLFICVRRGIVCTPFYQYGMYSAPAVVESVHYAPDILVDTLELNPQDFSGPGWDRIVEPLDRFDNSADWNHMIWSANIQRILGAKDSVPYTNAEWSYEPFIVWYTAYLSEVLHRPVYKVQINYRSVRWMEEKK